MTESDARAVLLVRAYEEPITPPWTTNDATWATLDARREVGEHAAPERLISRRARLALQRLAPHEPLALGALSATGGHSWIGWAIVAAAFVVGVAGDAVGSSQRINLLAPPLLALLAWNLAVYVALIIGRILRLVRGSAPVPRAGQRVVARLIEWAAHRRAQRETSPPLRRFFASWAVHGRRMYSRRASVVLHAAAATLAAGALASLYMRGLAFDFRAGWDSTFLSAETVQRLLHTVLGPAAQLLGISLPNASQLEALRFANGPGENAARWIHLHAATMLAVVVLPRLALAARAAWLAHRLAKNFPLALDDAYVRRLMPQQAGEPLALRVQPFNYQAPPEAAKGLETLVERHLGRPAALTLTASCAEGEEAQCAATVRAEWREPTVVLALFALTATPEHETHGRFVQALADATGHRPVVLIDESGFRQRFGDSPRLAERRTAWRALLAPIGIAAVFADLVLAQAENEAIFTHAFTEPGTLAPP